MYTEMTINYLKVQCETAGLRTEMHSDQRLVVFTANNEKVQGILLRSLATLLQGSTAEYMMGMTIVNKIRIKPIDRLTEIYKI